MKKVSVIVMCFVLVVAMLTACSAPAQEAPAAAPAATQEAAATREAAPADEATPASAAGEAKDVAIVSISPSEANNARFIQGITDACNEIGWTVSVTDAHGSADEANAAMQNFVTKGTDFIVDMVYPVTSLASGLQAAKASGIPVATWGGGIGGGVAVTNGSGGPHAIPIAKMMCEDMGGEGEILALTYHTGQVAREREEELDKVLKDYPNITVTRNEVRIPGYLQDGAQYANAWLAGRPENGTNYAIWGSWDDPALGAISSLKQMERKDVKVYGQNGNADAILAVQDGWMTATAWQDSYSEGLAMVEHFQQILEQGDAWEAKAIELDAVIITADNVADFVAQHPEAVENLSGE